MLGKTEPLGFLSNMLLPYFKCKESFGYVGLGSLEFGVWSQKLDIVTNFRYPFALPDL